MCIKLHQYALRVSLITQCNKQYTTSTYQISGPSIVYSLVAINRARGSALGGGAGGPCSAAEVTYTRIRITDWFNKPFLFFVSIHFPCADFSCLTISIGQLSSPLFVAILLRFRVSPTIVQFSLRAGARARIFFTYMHQYRHFSYTNTVNIERS